MKKTIDTICKYDKTSTVAQKTKGAKYSCEVKPGVSYTFYVLSYSDRDGNITNDMTKATSINLILDRNICSDGTLTENGKTCLVAWYLDELNNVYGPITAMNYLYESTSDWVKIEPLNFTYKEAKDSAGYTSFISNKGLAEIISFSGTPKKVGTETLPLRTRMPIESEIEPYNGTNLYLYNFLIKSGTIQTNEISGISGYWTLSSRTEYYADACVAYTSGYTSHTNVNFSTYYGVRPVINLRL